jgi:hypothetical protein
MDQGVSHLVNPAPNVAEGHSDANAAGDAKRPTVSRSPSAAQLCAALTLDGVLNRQLSPIKLIAGSEPDAVAFAKALGSEIYAVCIFGGELTDG